MIKLSAFNFLFYSTIAFHGVFLPLFFEDKGLSIVQTSIILSVGTFVSILSQPLWGAISDQRKTVKKIIFLLACGSLIFSFFMFTSSTFFYSLVFTGMFMFFMTPIQPLTDTLTVNYATTHRKDYGLMRLWGSVGFALFACLLGYIIDMFGIGSLGGLFALTMGTIILFSLFLDDIKKEKEQEQKKVKINAIFSNTKFLLFLGMVLLIGIPARLNDNLFGLYMNMLGASKAAIGTSFLLSAMSEVPIFILAGYLLKTMNPLLLISIGSCFYTLRWGLYSLIDEPRTLMFLALMQSVTFTFVFTGGLYYVAQSMPKQLMATSQAVFTTVLIGISGIIGSAFGGWIMDIYGASKAYQFSFLLAVCGTAFSVYLYVISRRENLRSIESNRLRDGQHF
jgi:PPP family 3-phenylpropionic acid transporter